MLTIESLEKIFEVLAKIKVFYEKGYPLEKARHRATEEVSKHHGITYQTIEDGYRRRLGLRNIHEFQVMIEDWIRGNSKSLINLLTIHTDKANHMRLYEFFESDKTIMPIKETANNKPIILYLNNELYDQMKLIAKQKGKTDSEWLSEKCELIITDEYVNYVKNEIGKLTEEQKRKLFRALQ